MPVDGGAGEPVCPVESIFYEDDVPEEWADYYDVNVKLFDKHGSPGGASKLGVIDDDRYQGPGGQPALPVRSRR